ncbi:MAG: pyridoxamine 5'-phosphate oxidase family protein [Betaproteobacteria bacterium]|nr:pyridoxamine 5'-phosphate oxidase family protein [Betaproteobacteria bacterium]
MSAARHITTIADLEALYGAPMGAALTKEVDYITDQYRVFIEKAPFVVVATVGPEGLDCSPRGDPVGFVRVIDRKRMLIPDRRGNNRMDSMRNIIRDPRISLLFLIPGVNETLRINGRARIIVDEGLAKTFAVNEKVPTTLLEVTAERVYYQCPKALIRSKLWTIEAQVPRSALPTGGQILAEITKNAVNAEEYDAAYPERIRQTIY